MAMFQVTVDGSLESWRDAARRALRLGVSPDACVWRSPDAQQADLFAIPLPGDASAHGARHAPVVAVPRAFVERARRVACHRSPERWALLYRLLWRIAHGEARLLDDVTDPDVRTWTQWDASVRRDSHKMKAFVRFKRIDVPSEQGGGDAYVAWHRTEHLIVPLVAPFFSDRFAPMRWSIFTPDASAHWDTERLRFGPGAGREVAADDDVLEDLWRDYYRSIFNPARVKVQAMRAEMPAKHWSTLPESRLIAGLLREAPARVQAMVDNNRATAAAFVPPGEGLARLSAALPGCTACDGCAYGGAAVMGRGPAHARLAIVSAYPVMSPDATGSPSHDGLLDEALAAAGLSRDAVYLTAASKAPPTASGATPGVPTRESASSGRLEVCRPWLVAELDAVQPAVVLCLGALAGRSVFGRAVSVTRDRTTSFTPATGRVGRLTYALTDVAGAAARQRSERWQALVHDLRDAAALANLPTERRQSART
jgi:uracil-DNA glycosylase